MSTTEKTPSYEMFSEQGNRSCHTLVKNITKKIIDSNIKIYSDNINIRLYLLKNGIIPKYINKTYDMFYLNNISNKILLDINTNINHFNYFINNYKNILFICGDYPNYGGAATNCDNLEKYYKNKVSLCLMMIE